jgi:hypothetical protein
MTSPFFLIEMFICGDSVDDFSQFQHFQKFTFVSLSFSSKILKFLAKYHRLYLFYILHNCIKLLLLFNVTQTLNEPSINSLAAFSSMKFVALCYLASFSVHFYSRIVSNKFYSLIETFHLFKSDQIFLSGPDCLPRQP